MNSTNTGQGVRPPPFSKRFIRETAEDIGEALIDHMKLPAELLCISFDAAYEHIIYPKFEIALVEDEDLGYDDTGEKILGRYDPFENVAFIDESLRHDPRRTFTCWHEVGGHGVLQGKWLRQELERLHRRGHVSTTKHSLDLTTMGVLERQANLFASHAGAPHSLLCFALVDLLNPTRAIRYIGPRKYTLDFHGVVCKFEVESLFDLCQILAKQIQWRFGNLSVEALCYRIQSLPLIQDETAAGFSLHRTAKLASVTFPSSGASFEFSSS